MDIVDLEELQDLQDTFALATGMAAVIVDRKGVFLTKPSNFTDFCKCIRESEVGIKRCEACDADGSGIYVCHAGLTEFAEPIMINDVEYGKVLGGQVFSKEPDIEKLKEFAGEFGISEDEYREVLERVPVRSKSVIGAACKLLKEWMNLFVNFQYERKKNGTKLAVLEDEMEMMVSKTKDITMKTRGLEKISKEQTILSLNASIEAGRAGDAGKGFSIVANQMGELAESSAKIYEAIVEDARMIHSTVEHLENAFK